MKLSVLMKCRIAATAAAGVIIIGLGAWSLVAPEESMGVVSIGTITVTAAVTLIFLAVLVGFVGYFLAWPYGREIGGLAVPAGLAVWAIRTGNMKNLMLLNQSIEQRQEIFATFTWEPALWLIIVVAGFAGVRIAGRAFPRKQLDEQTKVESDSKSRKYINSAIAVIGSVVIARFFIEILAQDFRLSDVILGSIVAQPATAQIAFAVVVSFGIAAFLIKTFLNTGYIWSIFAAAVTTALMSIRCKRPNVLQRLFEHYPSVFFSNAIAAILPLQMIAFGTLGAIAGYWLAVRYQYWRKHGI